MPNSFSNIRILIVDDDEDDFIITSGYIRDIPENQFQIEWCYNYAKALEHVRAGGFDLYFVDYRLGAKTGVDLLKEARQLQCEEPIVLLTGKGNKVIDVEAMQLGATDYLVKGELTTEKIERCIRYAIERSVNLKALTANERKFRNIFEKSKDIIFIASRDLNFIDVNPTAVELLGFAKDELHAMSVYDLLDGADKETVKNLLIIEKDITDHEVELLTKTGEKKNCILSLSLQENNDGKGYVQGIIHDITNLKKAEKANLQMEKLAATGRLVHTLAHEVRNPLNNINMSVEQLISGNATEETQLYFDIIHRNCHRISGLITELLDSSRPTELSFQKISLQQVMDESITTALDRITLKKIKLQVIYSNDPAYVNVDINKIKIGFLNIIINAIEAMEAETGKLLIKVNGSDTHHEVIIGDNGCGIPEENISRLFEPYFTSKRNGMGLGLASTLNILQSHKAQVDVSSVINFGTTFTIRFPKA
jgi:PAS domain S-box-containing protein